MSRKTVILTEIIAPYRIPVFNVLASRAEVDLHVIFLAETDKTVRQWHVYRNEISFSYQVLPSWRWRAGANSLLLNWGLSAALNKSDPQVIICGGYNYLASWQALWWARRHRADFVLWSESNGHDTRSGKVWVEFLKRYFLSKCDRFVVPGKASFQYLEVLGSAGKNIVTAHNAVDNSLFAPQPKKTNTHPNMFRERLKLPLRFILF